MQNPFIHIQKILSQCGELAFETHGDAVSVEHLMLGFMRPKDSQISDILQKAFGMNPDRFMDILYSQLKHDAQDSEAQFGIDTDPTPANKLQLDSEASEVMRNSVKEAFICDHTPFVEPKHILLAILKQTDTKVTKMLTDAGITYDVLKNYLKNGQKMDSPADTEGGMTNHAAGEVLGSKINGMDEAYDEDDVHGYDQNDIQDHGMDDADDYGKSEEMKDNEMMDNEMMDNEMKDNEMMDDEMMDDNEAYEEDDQEGGLMVDNPDSKPFSITDEEDDEIGGIDPDDEPLDLSSSGPINGPSSNTSQQATKKTKSNTPAHKCKRYKNQYVHV